MRIGMGLLKEKALCRGGAERLRQAFHLKDGSKRRAFFFNAMAAGGFPEGRSNILKRLQSIS